MARVATVVAGAEGTVVCERCAIAETPLRRLKGLLGRSDLPRGEGLFLRPAPSVHTAFMRFSIDAVFVDRDLTVVGVADNLRPWRAAGRRGAHAVLELPAGESARRGIERGDRLSLVPLASPAAGAHA